MRGRSKFLTTFLPACALLLIPGIAPAQETTNYASLGGRVTDPSDSPIYNVRVTAREISTNITSSSITDHEGRFRFAYLKVGEYELDVSDPGFQELKRRVTLTVGSAFELPMQLTLGTTATSIMVSDVAPVLEAARTQIASTISQAEVKELPLNGRSYFDIALFIPGVSPTNTAANQLFAETSEVPGQGISVGSQRNFSNSFIIDGVSANDDAAGDSFSIINLSFVSGICHWEDLCFIRGVLGIA